MEKQAATVAVPKSTNIVDEEIKKKLLSEYGHQSEEESLYPFTYTLKTPSTIMAV